MILEKVILGVASAIFTIYSAVGIVSISNPSLTVKEYCANNGRILIDNSSYRPMSKWEIKELIDKTPETTWFSFTSGATDQAKQEQLISECKKLFEKQKNSEGVNWDKSVERAEKYCSVEEE